MPPLNTGRNGGEPTSVEPDSDVTVEPARKRREFRLPVLSRVSIQSKLLVMLLITSGAVGGRGRLYRLFIGPPFVASVGLRQDD